MKVFNFTLFLLLFLVACSIDEIVEHEVIITETSTEITADSVGCAPRTLSLKAAMPSEESDAKTRVSLTETDEGSISVTWKEGDKIGLCFVSEDGTIIKTVSGVAMSNISEDGKRASFDVVVPDEICGTFNLYGVYGASFATANSTTVLLPTIPDETELSHSEVVCDAVCCRKQNGDIRSASHVSSYWVYYRIVGKE